MGPSNSAVWGLPADYVARISFQAMNLNKSPAVPSGGWEQDFSASLDVLESSTQNYIPSDEIRSFNPILRGTNITEKHQHRWVSWGKALRTDRAAQKRPNHSLSLTILMYIYLQGIAKQQKERKNKRTNKKTTLLFLLYSLAKKWAQLVKHVTLPKLQTSTSLTHRHVSEASSANRLDIDGTDGMIKKCS